MATTQDMIRYQAKIFETGITELVGKDEKIDQNDYGASVAVDLGAVYSGELYYFTFIATEEGTGAVQDSAGTLYIFDADPASTAGDTALTAAEWKTLIGRVDVEAADWIADANGGSAHVEDKTIPFHDVQYLYLVWKQTDATGLNDAAGDDEVLECNIWLRRDN